MDGASLIISMTVVALSLPMAWSAVRVYRAYGGLRPVICPETQMLASVRIDTRQAVAGRLIGKNTLCLRSCSRWPERTGCNQACVGQIIPLREPRGIFRVPASSRTQSTNPSPPATA